MKTSSMLITLSIAFFITSGTATGASVWTDTSTTDTDNWVSVSFINADTGWVASADGIVATRNGWNTWFASGGGIRAISEIQFVDENTGWYVADSGEIRHTSNGGLDWETQTSGTDHNLYDLFFLDNQTGWVVGDSVVLKTVDAGASWSELTTPANLLKFEDIYFVDNTHGWIVDQSSSRTDIFRTVDGGLTWSSSKGVGGNTRFFSVYFHDTLNGLVVGGKTYAQAKIYRTEDGGITWLPAWTPAYDASIPAAHLTEIDFLDNQRGIAVGKYGSIVKTSNGGLNWVRDRMPNTGYELLRSVAISTKSKAIAVGDNGRILSAALTFGPIVQKTPLVELNEDFGTVVIADLDTVFVDDDSPSVTYSVETNGLCTASILGSELTLESSANLFGESIVTVTAQDEDLNIGTLKLEWTIQSENDAPTISGISDAIFFEDDSLIIQLDTYVGDIEDDADLLEYSATVMGDNADNLAVQFEVEVYTWGEVNKAILKPSPDSSGIFMVVFEITDTELAVGADTVQITVTPVNDPPVITSALTAEATEHEYFFYQGSASDPENDVLSWTFESISSGLTASSDSLFGTITELGAIESYIDVIGLSVSDGQFISFATLSITLFGVNDPPFVGKSMDTSHIWEDTQSHLVTSWIETYFGDPERDTLTYTAKSLGEGIDSIIIGNTTFTATTITAHSNLANKKHADEIKPARSKGEKLSGKKGKVSEEVQSNRISTAALYSAVNVFPTPNFNGETKVLFSAVDKNNIPAELVKVIEIKPLNDPPFDFLLKTPADSSYLTYWGGRTLDLNWHEAVDIDGDTVSYRVELADDFGWQVIDTSQTTSLNVNLEDFPRSTWIRWDVIAMDSESETKCATSYWFNIHQVVGNENTVEIPDEYSLNQNYPNPFNPITNIRYGLPEVADFSLIIFDLKGRIIRQWFATSQIAGWHELQWNGKDHSGNSVSTGVYFAWLQSGDFSQTIKMVYLK